VYPTSRVPAAACFEELFEEVGGWSSGDGVGVACACDVFYWIAVGAFLLERKEPGDDIRNGDSQRICTYGRLRGWRSRVGRVVGPTPIYQRAVGFP
jgi:hypothetical protein